MLIYKKVYKNVGDMMYRKIISTTYVLNIIFQSFFNLAFPIGLGILSSWLLVEKAGAPGWIYAPIVIIGVIIGFSSMIRFILSAMRALERLEMQKSPDNKRKDCSNDRK